MSSTPTVTIRDVALAAGVHVSTVSRALDPAKRRLISAEVLELVEATARRLGYRPNRAAFALRTGRTHTIGVLIPDITNAVFPPIVQGIEASAAARAYFVFVANAADNKVALNLVERMLAQQVDGLVLAIATRDDPLLEFVSQRGIQAVLVNRADETGRLAAVVSDDRLAMKMVVEHLVQSGHRRIAHLAGPQHVPTGAGRREGFEQAMRAAGLVPTAIVEAAAFTREAGQPAAADLLKGRKRADAIVCANDLLALGAYDVARTAGLRIPDDVSITGHNDMPLVDMIDPPLTTIRLPHRELGWRAAEMLFERIGGTLLSPSTVVLRPQLIVRASTRPAPA